ncbi:MAG TPA: vanadium-dependent haloperoxidase [Bryobacteraceae bacterium]
MKTIINFSISIVLASGIATADEVTDWNHIMLTAMLAQPVTPAPVATRTAAIFQSAVFDAANGVAPLYKPIYVAPAAPRGTSIRAAVVQAAYASLLHLYPDQKSSLDQHRSDSLAAITDANEAVQAGLIWGQYVADEIWGWRSLDGFSDSRPPYLGGNDPGQWRPTPPAMAPGLVPQLAQAAPWVLQSPSQFRPAGPAGLTSDQYTADFNETKSMGGATNSGRTADATLYASFWQAGNPPDYWDPVVISLAAEHHLSMVETAQALALVNMGIADSIVGCWDAKYAYSSWRPITAIQLADSDGNDRTTADSAWTPLIVTPPFPEYPSAHSCASGAATHILSQKFGEESSFNVVSNAMPGVTRNFHNFTAALSEVVNARIYGGIHFRTACVDGTALGIAVGDYVMTHAVTPLRKKRQDQDQ